MSGTYHHSKRHGSVKDGEGTKRRACGHEYWGRRASVGDRPDIQRERAQLKRALRDEETE